MKEQSWFQQHPLLTFVIVIFGMLFLAILYSGVGSPTQNKIQIPSPSIEEIGYLVVSGEEAGTCYVKDINLWSEPKSAVEGAYVIGKISNACPQKTVPYYDLTVTSDRIWYKVKSGGKQGWITDSFVIGRK